MHTAANHTDEPILDDTFHVVGYTTHAIASGAMFHDLDLFMATILETTRYQARGATRRHFRHGLVEVYFVDSLHRIVNGTAGPLAPPLSDAMLDDYQTVHLLSTTAVRLHRHHKIGLPPILGTLRRSALPRRLGTFMRFPVFEFATAPPRP